ncbi:MAG: ABC transporter permease, partial [Candidatus Eremiobacterota bacterium]
ALGPDLGAADHPVRQRAGWLLVLPLVLWMGAFYLIPMISVTLNSLHTVNADYEIEPAYTLENFTRAANPDYLPVLKRSVAYAAATTAFCLLLGYPLAYFIALHGGRNKGRYLVMLMLPFWTSYMVRTYAWKSLLQTEGLVNGTLQALNLTQEPVNLLNTPFSVILGLTYCFLPFAALPIYVSLERMDRRLLEASADLGGSPASTFWRVVFPLSQPGVVAAVLLTFVPALGDFVTPELLGGPETFMIGNLIQEQFLQLFDWPFGSALALLLMLLMLLSIAAYLKLSGSERDLV